MESEPLMSPAPADDCAGIWRVKREKCPGGSTSYIRMIGMIVVFFRGCNRRFSIFRGCSSKILQKDTTGIY